VDAAERQAEVANKQKTEVHTLQNLLAEVCRIQLEKGGGGGK